MMQEQAIRVFSIWNSAQPRAISEKIQEKAQYIVNAFYFKIFRGQLNE